MPFRKKNRIPKETTPTAKVEDFQTSLPWDLVILILTTITLIIFVIIYT